MKTRVSVRTAILALLAMVAAVPGSFAQTTERKTAQATPMAATAPTVVPALVPYSGIAIGGDGRALAGDASVTFLIYEEEQGGEPLFAETQTVAVDATGHYTAQLGASLANGIPISLFATGEARWLEVQVAGQPSQPRVLLASVPYALKAGDAATLGGLPASAYALVGQSTRAAVAAAVSPDATPPATGVTTTGGTADYLTKFSGASAVVDSILYDSGTAIGIGTNAPAATLDIHGTTYLRGSASLYDVAPATASAGSDSAPLIFLSSVWDSSTKAAVKPSFKWQAEPTGNNTTTPGATLNLLSSNGIAAAAETGFHFNSNGTINFAPGQTFSAAALSGAITASSTEFGGDAIAGTSTGPDGTGVVGAATGQSGIGVSGSSTSGTGVEGTTAGTGNTAGVYGVSGAGTGSEFYTSAGVWGDSQLYVGVVGTSASGLGGAFSSSGPLYPALAAKNSGLGSAITASNGGPDPTNTGPTITVQNNGSGPGVLVGNFGNGVGVLVQNAGNGAGVAGENNGSGPGVYGMVRLASHTGQLGYTPGIWADTGDAGGLATAFLATADDTWAGLFYNNSSTAQTLYAQNDTTSGAGSVVFAAIGSQFGGSCTINVSGDLGCNGNVSDVVKVDNGARQVETYSMQSTENWFEDFGSGQLSGGVVRVDLDPTFAQTVNAGVEYHVFLTPNEDCKGLYASHKTATAFEVRELGGGKSSVTFDYRIVAKRAGYENVRLKDVTEQMKQDQERQEKMGHPGNASPQVRPIAPSRHVEPATRNPLLHTPIPVTQPTVITPSAKVADLK